MTALKTVVYILLFPGLLMVILPIWLIGRDSALFSFGVLRWLAVPLWLAGAVVGLWCAWDITTKGRGAPIPIDPPRELVVSGLYRHVRNPIYLGALAIYVGYAFWHPSPALLACLPLLAVSAHLFVVLYEEPSLRKRFGPAYEAYCRSVPRWVPRRRR
jgi:protein-S-isoprenylcysteine O-methyltransferase Ste14